MTHTFCSLALGGLLLGAATGAHAQHMAGAPQPRLVVLALDTDHDGQLAPFELAAAPAALLTLDRNGDGQLTEDEWQPRPENAGASADELVAQLMSLDRNGDGVLTPDELPPRMANLFARGDTNQDGKLTPEEIRHLAQRQGMPRGAASSAVDPGAATRRDPVLHALDLNSDGVIEAAELATASQSLLSLDSNHDGIIEAAEMRLAEPSPAERTDHLLGEWDTDKDGKLSKAEAPDRLQAQWAQIDTNGDGFLERDELMAYFAAQAQGGKQ